MNKTNNTLEFNVTAHGDIVSGCGNKYNMLAESLTNHGYQVSGSFEDGDKIMHVANITNEKFDKIANTVGIKDTLAFVVNESEDYAYVNEDDDNMLIDECSCDDCDIDEDAYFEEDADIDLDAPYFDEFVEEDIDNPFNDVTPVTSEFDDEAYDVDGSDLGWEGEVEAADTTKFDDLYDTNITEYDDDIEAAFESVRTKSKRRLNESTRYNRLRLKSRRRLNESIINKRKGCCPPKRNRRLNESASVPTAKQFIRVFLEDLTPMKVKNDIRMTLDSWNPKSQDELLLRFTQELVTQYFEIYGYRLMDRNQFIADNEYELTDAVAFKFGDILETVFNQGVDAAFESVRTKRNRRLNESVSAKRNSNNLVSLTEALKSFDEKDQNKLDKSVASVEDVLKMVKGQTIGEKEARDAFAKLKKEQNALKKIKKNDKEPYSVLDVPGVTKAIKAMIAADPEKADEIKKFRSSLTESVVTCLANKKKSIHENMTLNGRKMSTIPYNELVSLYESMKAKKMKFANALKNTDLDAKNWYMIKEALGLQNESLNAVAEELSYRRIAANVFARLNEEEEADTDKKSNDEPSMEELNAMFGASDAENDEAKTEDADDDVEEVELARVVIEMASKEDAEQLMDLCKEAGIPEEAMEIQEGDEEAEESDDEDTSDIEENDEEESDEEDSKEKNESVHYKSIRRLFEADEEGETDTEDKEDESDDTEETESEDESEEDVTIKFVLTDTDYVETLGQVLNDEYGISEEEFEGMIGGEVVESDDDDESDEDKDSKEDKDSEEDDIDVADIFGNM